MTTHKVYIPETLGRPVETPLEALTAAREIIETEGRWTKDAWFIHADTQHPEYGENPYCNGWATCAAGAVQLVTLGVQRPDPVQCGIPNCTSCETLSRRWEAPGHNISEAVYDSSPPEERLYHDALGFLVDAVIAANPSGDPTDRWNAVPKFNDRPATTHEDIVAAFRAAENAAAAAEKVPA